MTDEKLAQMEIWFRDGLERDERYAASASDFREVLTECRRARAGERGVRVDDGRADLEHGATVTQSLSLGVIHVLIEGIAKSRWCCVIVHVSVSLCPCVPYAA